MVVATTIQQTSTESYLDLLLQVAEILAKHPAGADFRLMFVPEGITLKSDEVLVQHVNSEDRVIELLPCKIASLTSSDVVHDTQVCNPTDQGFNDYAVNRGGHNCTLFNDGIHVYVPR